MVGGRLGLGIVRGNAMETVGGLLRRAIRSGERRGAALGV